MKTKIIYISGNEVFEMAQIRAAFEEVRSTLGLDNDTILFGVPVDADNALADTVPEKMSEVNEPATIEINEITVTEEPDSEEICIIEEPEQIPELVQESLDVEEQPVVAVADVEDSGIEADKIIPILSILSTNEDSTETEVVTETATEPVAESVIEPASQPEIDSIDALTVSIDDVVADDAPVAESKKTLEELLESMEPLGEDETPVQEPEAVHEEIVEENTDFSISMTDDATDTDATLAQLASEFAQTQDKIPDTPKPSSGGKIGKLKNILPFKKAKRDDSGLMGDLFGWAGIAANDEDFSIPGFFTSAGGQK